MAAPQSEYLSLSPTIHVPAAVTEEIKDLKVLDADITMSAAVTDEIKDLKALDSEVRAAPAVTTVEIPADSSSTSSAPDSPTTAAIKANVETYAGEVAAATSAAIDSGEMQPLNKKMQEQASAIEAAIDAVASPPMSAATKLKKMVEETNELIVCPGVYDGLSARVAHEVGFPAMYMTGAGTTASRLGQPDLGIAQLSDMRAHAEMIANLDPYGAPLIADMDTGWGGPIMVATSVAQYIRAGVAGFHIEDQIQNKRCGHLAGKRVVSREEFWVRIRAAKAAKDRLHSDIVLIARTDANQMHGYEECIERLKVARDIGADVGLLEGFKSKEEARRAVQELAPWPLLLNSVENGASPLITVDEAREMGFRIMIFSFAALAPAYVAIKNTFTKLKNEGIVGTAKDLTPIRLFEVCGLRESMLIDKGAGGENFALGI